MEKTASQPDALAELALLHQQQSNVQPISGAQRVTGG
jgi:hypothetical protein